LLEDKDLKLYQSKFGIKNDEMESIESLKESLDGKSILGKKGLRSKRLQR
jgi:hypothetical protein